MTAGLPGTSLGGIFYFLLVLWMPVRELYLTVRGRSSIARWKRVAFQWSMVSGILAALWLEVVVLNQILLWLQSTDTFLGHWLAQLREAQAFAVIGRVAAVMSLATLATICLSAGVLNLVHKSGWLLRPIASPNSATTQAKWEQAEYVENFREEYQLESLAREIPSHVAP